MDSRSIPFQNDLSLERIYPDGINEVGKKYKKDQEGFSQEYEKRTTHAKKDK